MLRWICFPSLLLCLAFVQGATGCSGAWPGRFVDEGFRHRTEDYLLRYAASDPPTFVSDAWRLENWVVGRDGRPRAPRKGEPYRTVYRLREEWSAGGAELEAFRFDIRLEHRNDDSLMWLQTVPLSWMDEDKHLDVLLAAWVANLSGSALFRGRETIDGEQESRERRMTSLIVNEHPAIVQGHEAYSATIHLAEVDRLAMAPEAVDIMMKVVLVRAPFTVYSLPAILVFGYQSRPAVFDSHDGEFRDFVSHITFPNAADVGAVDPDEEEGHVGNTVVPMPPEEGPVESPPESGDGTPEVGQTTGAPEEAPAGQR